MPPQLALLLCTAFVLFLLRLEKRVSRGVSWAVWIPTLWMMIGASRPLALWFDLAGNKVGHNESGSVLDRWSLTALAVAGIVVLVRRRFDWAGSLRRQKWLLALFAYMFASTLWSEITAIALRRWVREVIVVVFVMVIVSETNPRQALQSILRRTAYVLLPFSLVLIKYYPVLGVQYGKWSGALMWVGVTTQKNQLGRLCMISAFFLLWVLYRTWRDRTSVGGLYQKGADISILLLAIFLLNGSENAYSATSLATLSLGIITFLGLRWVRKMKFRVPLKGLLALVIFLMALGVSMPFRGGSALADFTSSLGRDETLTGRTEVWAAVLPAMQQQPLLGYGLGSFWTDARRKLYDIPTAHNGYLDILLELGAVGLAFYALWMLSCARQLHRALAQDYDWAGISISFLLMGLLYNVTESALNTMAEQMTSVVVLASLVVPASLSSRSAANASVPSRADTPSLETGVHCTDSF